MSLAPAAAPRAFQAGDQSGHNLWHYVWKLLRLRAVISISGFRHARLRRKIVTIFLALLVLAFAVFVFWISWLLLGFLNSPELARVLADQKLGAVTTLIESVPTLILGAVFVGLLLSSFGVLLQALYLAGDMDFLLSAPVPIRAVFVTKLLQAILPNVGFVALFGLPVLFGLGVAGSYNLLYYPLVVIVLAMLALTAAGIASVLVMGIVRVFPARRVAEVLGLLGAVVSIVCSQSSNLINSTNVGQKGFPVRQIPLAWVTRFNSPWSPLAWAGRGLVDFGQGRWLTGVGFLALTLGLAGGLFLISLTAAERLYYTGWASLQVTARKKKATRAAPAAPPQSQASAPRLERLIPPAVRAIVTKDFLVLRRDLRHMSQMVMPIVVGVIYGFMLMRTSHNPSPDVGDAPAWLIRILSSLIVYGNVGISLFVGWSLLTRLALMSFSQEGTSYWLLKSAPVKPSQLMAAKFLVAYLPALALGWAFMLVISLLQQTGASILLFGLLVVALSIAGTAGINLAFGVVGANMTWEDPRRMNAGWPGCLSMVLSAGLLGLCVALFFLPPAILPSFGVPEAVGQVAGLALGGAVSAACAILPPLLALRRVARIGEA